MFERFTHDAREVVVAAQAEARGLGHRYIGTEHELLGLLADPDGTVTGVLRGHGIDAEYVRGEVIRRVGPRPPDLSFAEADEEDAAALKAIGIDLDAVRRAIEANFGAGALQLPRETAPPKKRGLFGRSTGPRAGHIPFTQRSKKVMELSLREAIRLNQKFIAPEHIMLGILREGGGLAMLILGEKGVDFGKLRDDLTRALHDRAA